MQEPGTHDLDSMPTLAPRAKPGPSAAPRAPASDSMPTIAPRWREAEEWFGRRFRAGETILGRYVVEGELGQGGMGVVYACHDQVGDIRVAVKALPPELAHERAEMEEVRDNFRLVNGLRHPNIAGVKTLERDANGEVFLVMDVAEGKSLREWLRERKSPGNGGRVPLGEAIPVLRQVAAALDYAHEMKVVHRDVKPGNVMLDAQGRVKVLDFGLAAQIRTSLSRASQAYRGTSGTGPYMAPEQWEAQPQDARTDQYALAAMAYELLAGRLPFENGEIPVLREAVLKGNVRPIPGLPKGAMAALWRGMAKDPAKRFASCGAFVEALAGGGRPPRGKTATGWLAALLVAAGLLAVGAWWWQNGGWARQEKPQQKAEAADETAEETPQTTQEDAASPEKEIAPGAESVADPEREVQIQRENEALEGEVFRLETLAATRMENEERMRHDRDQRFGEKLDDMRRQYEQGKEAMDGGNFPQAKECFEASLADASWLETNSPLRRDARASAAAAKKAKEAAAARDAARLGHAEYQEAGRREKAGAAAFGEARFEEASREWNAAANGYARAEKAAIDAKVAQYLEAARGAKRRGDWESVATAAEAVLKLVPRHAEAATFKQEAGKALLDAKVAQHLEAARAAKGRGDWKGVATAAGAVLQLVPGHAEAATLKQEAEPVLRVKAIVNGRSQSGAIVTCNGESWVTPQDKALAGDLKELTVTVEYKTDSNHYVGKAQVYPQKWGVTEVAVELAKCVENSTKKSARPDPAQIQTEAYIQMVQADQNLDEERYVEAQAGYAAALDLYETLGREFPDFSPAVIGYRISQCRKCLETLREKLAPSPDGARLTDEILLPAGSFLLGATTNNAPANEIPAVEVAIAPFYMARTPVTVSQFAAFVSDANHRPTPEARSWDAPGFPQSPNDPVVAVSWRDAVAYCNWLSRKAGLTPAYTLPPPSRAASEPVIFRLDADGYRLPLEAEWEYVARNLGKPISFPWGNDTSEETALAHANFAPVNSHRVWRFTSPVLTFPPSPLGVYDLAGNAAEWCQDAYSADAYSTAYQSGELATILNPPTPTARVIRGGSYLSPLAALRTTARGFGLELVGVPNEATPRPRVGFRVVRNAP